MAWERLGLTISAQRPLAELRAAYRRTDIIALDLDECICPGYSQTLLGERIARRILWRPARASDRCLLPQLALGGLLLGLREAKRLLGISTSPARLMAQYERVMRGIPEHYFREEAARVSGCAYPFATDTAAELARQAPTGIVTLGLDFVARAFVEAFRARGAPLSFFEANTVVFEGACGRPGTFRSYGPAAPMRDGEDKRRALERRMASSGARVPTTIGHSRDDLPLARLARERGGLAIAFNPSAGVREAFDVVVAGRDWEPMYALVAMVAAR